MDYMNITAETTGREVLAYISSGWEWIAPLNEEKLEYAIERTVKQVIAYYECDGLNIRKALREMGDRPVLSSLRECWDYMPENVDIEKTDYKRITEDCADLGRREAMIQAVLDGIDSIDEIALYIPLAEEMTFADLNRLLHLDKMAAVDLLYSPFNLNELVEFAGEEAVEYDIENFKYIEFKLNEDKLIDKPIIQVLAQCINYDKIKEDVCSELINIYDKIEDLNAYCRQIAEAIDIKDAADAFINHYAHWCIGMLASHNDIREFHRRKTYLESMTQRVSSSPAERQ